MILRRGVAAYRYLNASITSRPPPRPVPWGAERALNFLFIAICLYLFLSFPFQPYAPERNILNLTKSHLSTSTELLFNRLARVRPDEILTVADEDLKEHLTSVSARKIYLAYGPDTVSNCEFCSTNSLYSYLVFYLPFHVVLPHLIHTMVLLISTSEPLTGPECSRWRGKFTLAGLALCAVDIFLVFTQDALNGPSALEKTGKSGPVGYGFYYISTLARPFIFGVVDMICAGIIYLSSTNRFFFAQPSSVEQLDQGMTAAQKMLQGAKAKFHAANVYRNTVVRDKSLKQRDDLYWQTMAVLEDRTRTGGTNAGISSGSSTDSDNTVMHNIWEEPEVVQAMSRTLAGHGGVDLAQLGMNAQQFVRDATEGL